MSELTLMDVIGAIYSSPEDGVQPMEVVRNRDNTALLLIDIQGLVTPEFMAKAAVKAGLPEDAVDAALVDYGRRFYDALAMCSKLLKAAREHGVTPIHVKIEPLSGDGRDTSPLYRILGWTYPRSSEATKFVLDAAPIAGEIVLTKTVGGAFTGTILDRVLRHMGIQHLFVCGFVTDECVETTLRDALDLGYLASIVRDATTAFAEEDYSHVIAKFGGFGLAPVSDEVVEIFEQF